MSKPQLRVLSNSTKRQQPSTLTQRETNSSQARNALLRSVDHRIEGTVDLELLCVPSLLEVYMRRLIRLAEGLGKTIPPSALSEVRGNLLAALQHGHRAFNARAIVSMKALPPPNTGVQFSVRVHTQTVAQVYEDWTHTRTGPLFGVAPDAKVMDMAAGLGDPRTVPVLDVGAGTGRNALALARLGHPTDALETAPIFVESLERVAAVEGCSLEVIEADVLSPSFTPKSSYYGMIVVSEVLPHVRDIEAVRLLFERLSGALRPDGLLVLNAFVAMEGFKPEHSVIEASHVLWCSVLTRQDLNSITEQLPFDRMSDEAAFDYERKHLPPEHWPPTPWFTSWSLGLDLFDLPKGKAPIELRWLVYRRRPGSL